MAAPARISPYEFRRQKADDPGTLLVCAHNSEAKFRANHLDGAISLDAFQKQLDNIEKDQGIVFY